MPRRARARPAPAIPVLLLALTAWAGPAAWSQGATGGPPAPAIPTPTGFVNDRAGVMDLRSRAQLEGFLDQLRQKTGAEFAILTVKTTAPLTPGEYKVKVFERWGVGREGFDDGLLMLVAIEEREVRFETGYGLEGALPDGFQSRIFRREMAPRFRDGDFSAGIIAGALACARRIAAEKGVTVEWNGRELGYDGPARRAGVPFWTALLALLLLVALLAGLGTGAWRVPRPRRGWWAYPGSYWGGGLGRPGGGGFGGRSFGGFGGGRSGGGGGGGKW